MMDTVFASAANPKAPTGSLVRPISEQLLSKSAVAAILDLHPASIMRLVRAGKFPRPLKVGGIKSAVRWRARDVQEWIERNAAAAAVA